KNIKRALRLPNQIWTKKELYFIPKYQNLTTESFPNFVEVILTVLLSEITVVSIFEITNEVFSINTVKPNEFSCAIHPNPIKDDLNFQVFNAKGKILKVEIYNSIGCQLFTSEIEISTNKQNTIALPDLSPGIYFAKVFNEFNQNVVMKFIK
ncbi:MAG: T9SS type A sorting domain-containing protein, partial [Bacteroidales bacterium]|nr:T9SS type A sorting domain-containing protein [Bacteroidales bacterium]MCF8457839.1 T9SS type A sorting domain-containing protein [Bacteroidales bacterium]